MKNAFQKGANTLSKKEKKVKILCNSDKTILFQFHQHVVLKLIK